MKWISMVILPISVIGAMGGLFKNIIQV